MEKLILTINGGSSSIKFALYSCDVLGEPRLSGSMERIGLPGSTIAHTNESGETASRAVDIPDSATAVRVLNDFLHEHVDLGSVVAVGHRIVHGMGRQEHMLITAELIAELKKNIPLDPEHLPLEIALIEMFEEHAPHLTQIACFDTVFHRDMPRVATLLPLPRKFERHGVRRYGFHGLALQSVMERLQELDPKRAGGAVIVLHLGSGASVTAVKGGKCIDTSMGLTPAGGIPMSTRSGDIDPGALLYVMSAEHLSGDSLNHMINHESGLLGVSETSPNMRDLLDHEEDDERAKEAIDLFCYQAKKQIGAYVAALGGLDMLVFSGGMGEQAPRIRAHICRGLAVLGVVLHEERNDAGEAIISPPDSHVCIRVVHANEELTIARITKNFVHAT